jgi:hypothetical protein
MRYIVDMVSIPTEIYDEDCASDAEERFVDYIRENITTAWVEAVEDAPQNTKEKTGTSSNK